MKRRKNRQEPIRAKLVFKSWSCVSIAFFLDYRTESTKWTGCILCIFFMYAWVKLLTVFMWWQPNLFVALTEKGRLKKGKKSERKRNREREREMSRCSIHLMCVVLYNITECVWYALLLLLLLLLYFGRERWLKTENAKLLFAFIYLHLWM